MCGNPDLTDVLKLGDQTLSGIFPKSKEQKISKGPLTLTMCTSKKSCGLVQLKHTFNLEEMYGMNYGYRSGLNASMVKHLQGLVQELKSKITLKDNDFVIDVGSNDSTLLQSYGNVGLNLIGVDPTGKKFKEYYPSYVSLIPDFFPTPELSQKLNGKKVKAITSISMMYDLEDPVSFAKEVSKVLDVEGVWVFEQSYLPLMLEAMSFDTICHEHLEYYCLSQIKWMLETSGLKIIDVTLNDANGGSFRVTAAKVESALKTNDLVIQKLLKEETELHLDRIETWQAFISKMEAARDELLAFLAKAKKESKVVIGYGASTKGNVLLQYAGITPELLPYIAEVNKEKFGAFTPQTLIPIISEEEALKLKPHYKLFLPWHFRKFFENKEKGYLEQGGALIFPLPKFEIYKGSSSNN